MSDDKEDVGETPNLSLEPDSTADSIEQLDVTLNMTLDNDTSSTLNVIDTSSILIDTSSIDTSLTLNDTTTATQSAELDIIDNITSNTIELLDLPSTSTLTQAQAQEENKSEDEPERHRSRELDLLLALSKEAKLDTNLARKRKKTLSPRRRSKKKHHQHITGDMELQDEEGDKVDKLRKRKKSVAENEGGVSESLQQGGKGLRVEVPVFKPNKDMFCWRCHKDTVDIACETCPRSYHRRCLKQAVRNPDHWPCPECVLILKAENTQSMSAAMKDMTLEHLCSLLKFAIKRMIKCQGSEPFLQPVSQSECPDYTKYIIQPMNLSLLSQNIKDNLYGSPQAFEADAKWILHNSIIFNSCLEMSLKLDAKGQTSQSKLTSHAKSIIKICKQEMSEIENCSSCYLNANSKKDWFVDVCPKPHLLVWAKLRGFPFWPGKVMSYKDGNVDVRFFGAHDRAWIPEEDCFLFSKKDPNFFRGRRKEIEDCVKELEAHVRNLEKAFGEFRYAPFKTPVDPENEVKQLQLFLPRYRPGKVPKKHKKVHTSDEKKQAEEKRPEKEDKNQGKEDDKEEEEFDKNESMEGYGTDDETTQEMNTEFRKNLLQKSKSLEDNLQTSMDTTEELEEFIEKHADKKKSKSFSEPPSKRTSFETSISSKNSDAENDAPARKINRIDFICDNMELNLGNESVELKKVDKTTKENDSERMKLLKKTPIQVSINNSEIIISPSSKLKIAEKLMKRLSNDGEPVKKQILVDEVCENVEKPSDSSSESSIVEEEDKSEKSVTEATTEGKNNDAVSVANANETSLINAMENEPAEKVIEIAAAAESVDEPVAESVDNQPVAENIDKQPVAENSPESVEEYDDASDIAEANLDLSIDRANIMNIIHSSLDSNETPLKEPATKPKPTQEPKRGNKRKKSSSSDTDAVEIQNKIVKLATLSTSKSVPGKVSILKCTLTLQKDAVVEAISHKKQPTGSSKEIEEIIVDEEMEPSVVDIKMESEEGEEVDKNQDIEADKNQDIEAKKKYLSALNILEKGDTVAEKSTLNVIRTRSKTEEKREKSRLSDNMAKVIEDVVVNYGAKKLLATTTSSPSKPDNQEIFVKSFAKIATTTVERSSPTLPTTNQRARKSFPQPNYVKQLAKTNPQPVSPRIVVTSVAAVAPSKPATTVISSPIITTVATTATVQQPVKATPMPPLQPIETLRPASNGYLILQPNQQDGTIGGMVYVPPNRSISYTSPGLANQMVSMTPCLMTTPTNTSSATVPHRPFVWLPTGEPTMNEVNLNLSNSQNYIPQGENGTNGAATAAIVIAANSDINRSVVNGHPEPSVANRVSPGVSSGAISNASTEPSVDISATSAPNDPIQIIEPAETNDNANNEDLSLLNSIVPENVTRAVSEIIRRPPPKLKPRPPGALSQHFSEGIPSSAGPVTSKINSIAHRLGDYFRGMLIETLEDLGKSGDSEATIVSLKLELEQLKHQHQVALREIEKNTATVMRDVQKCVADDREKVVEEARAAWEAEAVKRVEEAKSKQWCANCSKEAQLYCCWNTSYCDYPCQQKHWPSHMSKCAQNPNQATTSAGVTLRPGPGANQIFLRPALNPPPKGSSVGRVIAAKPLQKVYLNRAATTPGVNKPKTMRVQTSTGSLLTMKETAPGNYQLVTSTPILRPSSVVTNNSIKPQQANILSITPPASVQSPPKNTTRTSLRIVGRAEEENVD